MLVVVMGDDIISSLQCGDSISTPLNTPCPPSTVIIIMYKIYELTRLLLLLFMHVQGHIYREHFIFHIH